jgi:hypothetical protein
MIFKSVQEVSDQFLNDASMSDPIGYIKREVGTKMAIQLSTFFHPKRREESEFDKVKPYYLRTTKFDAEACILNTEELDLLNTMIQALASTFDPKAKYRIQKSIRHLLYGTNRILSLVDSIKISRPYVGLEGVKVIDPVYGGEVSLGTLKVISEIGRVWTLRAEDFRIYRYTPEEIADISNTTQLIDVSESPRFTIPMEWPEE